MRLSSGVRAVALVEALKGCLVLIVGLGLLSLTHYNVRHVAEQLVNHLHLNPAKHYPQIFIDAAGELTNPRLLLLACGAAAYSAMRLIEAYGLWEQKRWAEWFAAISAGIYLPFELYKLISTPGWISATIFLLNGAVVLLMARVLLKTTPDRVQTL